MKKPIEELSNVLANIPTEKPMTTDAAYERMRGGFTAIALDDAPKDVKYAKKTIEMDVDKVEEAHKVDKYKYDEDQFVMGLKEHVDSTYSSHYGGTVQPVEFIMSNSETLDYLKGNVVKYVYRYGKKNGSNVQDLYKAVHFIMMMAKYSKE